MMAAGLRRASTAVRVEAVAIVPWRSKTFRVVFFVNPTARADAPTSVIPLQCESMRIPKAGL
jgi:hypothetical protein